MSPKWRNFDHWWVKMVAFALVIGTMAWMGYATWWHYYREHQCNCLEHWEYFPFVISSLILMFALAILSRKLTEGAANVVLPFATLVVEKMGRRKTDPVVAVPSPTSIPASSMPPELPDRGDKP